jgi:hypothetical protein
VLVVGGTATTDAARPLIQVASAEKKFTGTLGNAAKSDYDDGTAVAYIDLGTLTVSRAQYDSDGNGSLDAPVNKENGLAFDYQGSDNIKVTLTTESSTMDGWSAYSKVYLSTAACNVAAGLFGTSTTNDVVIDVTGQTTAQLEAGYNVCAVAKTTAVIPETNSITASVTADFFNARYMDQTTADKDYGVIRRNGCSVTLFNLPNTSASDDAFIRFTNVSAIAGSVRATVWLEDGTTSDVDVEIAPTIPAHGTLVFHTMDGLSSGIYLGDELPGFGAETSGRTRIILTGAFPACEALGLVRSSDGGPLTNMTSTTYSGDNSLFGADSNGTSNTKN